MGNWITPLLSAFLITALFMPSLIKYFRRRHEGQMIRDEGPKWHEKKSGTPTMGGSLFIVAIVITSLVYGWFEHMLNPTLLILLFVLVAYGLIGMWDDSIKLFKRRNLGLRAWQKLLGQIVAALVFSAVYIHEGFPMAIKIPFGGDLHLGYWYILFIVFWLVGFTNAVNLTDGLDGLVAGLGIISFAAYGIIAMMQRQNEVGVFCFAVVGGLLGFFIYNHKPAKIFMGDMGSLALGGALACVSVLVHHEFSLLIIGIIYVCETASVMIQVASFKTTGKRVFLMTPIHHHFEMKGWSEWKVDTVFWSIALVASAISILTII
ncbi:MULTISPECIES: phospho-N-acetylmuramoyl-pentapeptide-transferase [Lentilactobacillus]|jgi:phospho-N-acetylmuramoyl-pentapeptide-transferase|uniref:Phospho-N-acetylmuramoyl-pentapeptide-transferase n=3 Tax=Lentilactobacillus parabuchneri TaxID=152331 RepID=A0A844ELE7_9LACO|nr:phospho-N-acetylmuramoyl-pentapeptide-transferase [Lentilactobacillus parabuchneri]MBW0223625.1 phospho-N-acetylmuramoyl-pentapeptide-transferase [Lentilactobacillus parabuchneri]MBW0246369.1 phospho-N-acetylmuramoyl-pentapeptide-transferase [Lentilactobacillus parabuchneri]MBW0264325.1 phospho-N-acetylmuramoyl-pentapeptide-transferase [Lentilactobacillus parabuchneri]MCT2884858.1 phospho-N-acetylmuramoyl-pentapeptide-transferase [Lentilactobacillus parabuchneri]MCW4399079.1 phospho-N-acety